MRESAVIIAVTVLLACVGGGCGTSPAPAQRATARDRVVVPDVVGLPRSRASCALVAAGLRWRAGGEARAHIRAVVPCHEQGVHVAPDPAVKRQRPRGGRRVPPGRVVVLEDACTLLRFEAGGGACS